MASRPTANRLGALVLAINDRMAAAVEEATGHSVSAAATLSALHHFLRAPTIELLRQVIGLSHSGMVRLVDKLEREGLVRRRPGTDGRSTSVVLLARGHRAAERITETRASILDQVLEPVPTDRREEMDALIGKMLSELTRGPGATQWICRLCDIGVCGLEQGLCPLTDGPFPIAENVASVEARIAEEGP